jgi:hypothetical protein
MAQAVDRQGGGRVIAAPWEKSPWEKSPKDGYVFFRHASAGELQGWLPMWEDDITRLEREVERGSARGGRFYGAKGFAWRQGRLVEKRLELRRARIELRARGGHRRTAVRLQWIGECRRVREEILHQWDYGSRIWREIAGAETGCMVNGAPYAAATLRTYRQRLPENLERFAGLALELNILVDDYSTSWRTWRLGRPRGGATGKHLRVLDGGRA